MAAWRNWLKTLLKGNHEEPSPSLPPPDSPPPPTDTSVPVAPIKEWLIHQISPFAWDRVIIRLLSTRQDIKLSLSELLKPTPSTQIPSHLYAALSQIIQEMYGIRIPQNLTAIKI